MSEVITAREKAERDKQLNCRFYEAEYPDVDECVIVLVNNIQEMGAYGTLIEYNNIEGMILLSELSKRRIRSINKLIRVGKMEVCMVMRVDKEKGYIDLSRKKVATEDLIKCQERYAKAKAVNSIMRHVAETTGHNLLELNQKITWPLARKTNYSGSAVRPFLTAYEAFRTAINDPELIFTQPDVEIDEKTKAQLLKVIKFKIIPQPIKLRADIEVTCFGEEGIDAIRQALKAGEAIAPDDVSLKIRLIAPPLYVMTSTTIDRKKGLETMDNAITEVKSSIEKYNGKVEIKKKPRVTSQQDENSLKRLMEQMEDENAEKSGDDEG